MSFHFQNNMIGKITPFPPRSFSGIQHLFVDYVTNEKLSYIELIDVKSIPRFETSEFTIKHEPLKNDDSSSDMLIERNSPKGIQLTLYQLTRQFLKDYAFSLLADNLDFVAYLHGKLLNPGKLSQNSEITVDNTDENQVPILFLIRCRQDSANDLIISLDKAGTKYEEQNNAIKSILANNRYELGLSYRCNLVHISLKNLSPKLPEPLKIPDSLESGIKAKLKPILYPRDLFQKFLPYSKVSRSSRIQLDRMIDRCL